ncbi:ryR domain protein, partial [Ostertagia ostertagi]
RRRSFANSHQHNVNVTHSFAKLATEVKANRNRLQSKQYERKLSQLREEDFDYANDDDVESHSDYGSVKSHLDDDTKENKPLRHLKGSTSPPIVRSASKKRGPEHPRRHCLVLLPNTTPDRKDSSSLLFLDRVYGIDSQDMLFHFLEQSLLLPDLRAATMMDSVYRMNRLKSLTKNQRDAVSDFLVAITRELPPGMMIKLLRKVIVDIQQMSDMNVLVPLRLMTLHYERYNKYYGSGNQYGVATEVEKRLSMLLFYAIFDSLGSRPYVQYSSGRYLTCIALPCLTAIGSAISPDYTLTSGGDDTTKLKEIVDDSGWVPKTVDVSRIDLPRDLQSMTEAFAEHFHDSWASRKIEKGWVYGDLYSRQNLTHPRLKPYSQLKEFEKSFYKDRCAECLKALLAWNYTFELTDRDAADRAASARTPSGTSIQNFAPKPVDLSSMTLE